MKGLIKPADIYVKDTNTIKGRGVFASRDFAGGGSAVSEDDTWFEHHGIELFPK